MKKILLTLLVSALSCAGAFAQGGTSTRSVATQAEQVVTFRFMAGSDMFFIPWGGNDAELNRLYSLVEEYRAEITAGRMPVYVDGYCASDLKTAAVRSNRVKSELITNKGLTEENFVTNNHAAAYTSQDGGSHRDMVVVTLRIPAKPQPDNARLERERREREAAQQAERERREQAERERAERERAAQAERDRLAAEQEVGDALSGKLMDPVYPVKPYCFAVRTNLLYDAFLLPTLGVEWRASNSVGVKLDGSYSFGGSEHGRVQKVWLLNPEVRWYLLDNKRFYLGASANFGEYNIYKGMLGGLASKETGYQGNLWSGGATVGYQLPLNRNLSLDFNLGLGYTRFDYDSFTIIDRTRVYREHGKTKNFWGPTQAGINLIWTIGGNKQ